MVYKHQRQAEIFWPLGTGFSLHFQVFLMSVSACVISNQQFTVVHDSQILNRCLTAVYCGLKVESMFSLKKGTTLEMYFLAPEWTRWIHKISMIIIYKSFFTSEKFQNKLEKDQQLHQGSNKNKEEL